MQPLSEIRKAIFVQRVCFVYFEYFHRNRRLLISNCKVYTFSNTTYGQNHGKTPIYRHPNWNQNCTHFVAYLCRFSILVWVFCVYFTLVGHKGKSKHSEKKSAIYMWIGLQQVAHSLNMPAILFGSHVHLLFLPSSLPLIHLYLSISH